MSTNNPQEAAENPPAAQPPAAAITIPAAVTSATTPSTQDGGAPIGSAAETGSSCLTQFLQQVPLPLGGVTLAILALGNLLIHLTSAGVAAPLRWSFGVLFAIFYLPLVLKLLVHPKLVFGEDLKHPVIAPVLATSPVSLLLFATYVGAGGGAWHMIGLVIWWVGIVNTLALMLWLSYFFLWRSFSLKQVFPTWFMGFVGIMVTSVTAGSFGMEPLGRFVFWVDFPIYLAWFVVILLRLRKYELPPHVKPSIAILAAPMSLSVTAYLTCTPTPQLATVTILVILGQLIYLVILGFLPYLLRLPFSPSYAALTFPMVISASSLWQALQFYADAGMSFTWLKWGQIAETVIATAIVLYVAIRFVVYFGGVWQNTCRNRQRI